MEAMKIRLFATPGRATPKPNLLAKTDAVSKSHGIVIPTMIVVMDQMNQHTSVASGIVPPDGGVVLNGGTIVAFRNGFSAMERMIVAMVIQTFNSHMV